MTIHGVYESHTIVDAATLVHWDLDAEASLVNNSGLAMFDTMERHDGYGRSLCKPILDLEPLSWSHDLRGGGAAKAFLFSLIKATLISHSSSRISLCHSLQQAIS